MVKMLILHPKDQISLIFLSSVDPFPKNLTFITTLAQQIYFDHFMAMNQVQIMIRLNYIPESLYIDGWKMVESGYCLQFVTEKGQLSFNRVFIARQAEKVFLLLRLKPYFFVFMYICLNPLPVNFNHIPFLAIIHFKFNHLLVDRVNITQFGVKAGLLLFEIDSSKHSNIIFPAFIIFLHSSFLFLYAKFLPHFVSNCIKLFHKLTNHIVQLIHDMKHLVTKPTDIVQLLFGVKG